MEHSAPSSSTPAANARPLLEVRELRKHFAAGRRWLGRPRHLVRAVDGVDLDVQRGETLGVVGESGCGKTTLGRMIARLIEPTSGAIRFAGADLLSLTGDRLRAFRRNLQVIFQDPFGSLNPRMRVGDIVAEGLRIHGLASGAALQTEVAELLERVGLSPDSALRHPHEFSGGQRQRVGIARALAVRPRLIVADEPVSALDVSVQAQIVNLLQDLQEERGLSYLFIAHDLHVVEHISHRVAIMYLGRIVELAEADAIYRNPVHPYTRALLSAAPVVDPQGRRERIELRGEVASPLRPPAGCAFHPRCPFAEERCRQERPPLPAAGSHRVACHVFQP